MSGERLLEILVLRGRIRHLRERVDLLEEKATNLSDALGDMYENRTFPLWIKWIIIAFYERRDPWLCRKIEIAEAKLIELEFRADTLFDVEYAEDFLEGKS